jgi:hypothetical protein
LLLLKTMVFPEAAPRTAQTSEVKSAAKHITDIRSKIAIKEKLHTSRVKQSPTALQTLRIQPQKALHTSRVK